MRLLAKSRTQRRPCSLLLFHDYLNVLEGALGGQYLGVVGCFAPAVAHSHRQDAELKEALVLARMRFFLDVHVRYFEITLVSNLQEVCLIVKAFLIQRNSLQNAKMKIVNKLIELVDISVLYNGHQVKKRNKNNCKISIHEIIKQNMPELMNNSTLPGN